jgi:type IV pilus assembly protein PilO
MELGLEKYQAHIEKLAKLPRPYRLGILAAIALLVVGGYTYAFYLPGKEQLGKLRAQQLELQRRLNEVRSVAANLAAFEEELGRLERELTVALRQLPNSKELPVLLTDISTLGKSAGLEFKAFRPQAEVPREFYAEVPITIEFTGGYHDVARFFDAVSKLPRIVNVSELQMSILSETSNETRLQVKGSASTFRFLEMAAQPKNDQAAPGAVPARPVRRGGAA